MTRSLKNGKHVGFSTFSSYSYNERSMLSLGILDNEQAKSEPRCRWSGVKKAADRRSPRSNATGRLKSARP